MSDRSVVMIVDDHDSLRRAARRLIKSYGFAVDTFFSAEDFLASGRLDETACLVLDVHMPGLSGLVLQTRLNVIGYHISIVFITAFADDNTRAKALQHNAYGYRSCRGVGGNWCSGISSEVRLSLHAARSMH
jgi:FixJ family two-component response regulator